MTTSAKPFFDEATKQKMEVSRVFAVDLQAKLTRVRSKRLLKEGKATGMKPASEIAASDLAIQMLTHNNPVLPVRQASQVARDDEPAMPSDYWDTAEVESDADATSMFLDAYQTDSKTTNSVKTSPEPREHSVSHSGDNEGEGESADAPPEGHDELDFMGDVWSSGDLPGVQSPMDVPKSEESIIDDAMDELFGMVSKNTDEKSGRSDESSASGDDEYSFLNSLDVKTNDKIMSKDLTQLLKDVRG